MNILKRLVAGLAAGAVAFYGALYLLFYLGETGLNLPGWAPIVLVGVAGFVGTGVVAAMSGIHAARVAVFAAFGLIAGLVAGWLSTQVIAVDGLEWLIVAVVVIISVAAVSTASD